MADIIPFPVARQAAPVAASVDPAAGVSAAVYQLPAQPAPVVPVRAAKPAVGTDAPASLDTLTAQMRADSQALVRCMAELQEAVHDLVEADLPGQARALVAKVKSPCPTSPLGASAPAEVSDPNGEQQVAAQLARRHQDQERHDRRAQHAGDHR